MNFFIVFCFSLVVLCSCLCIAFFGKTWNLKPMFALGAGALLSLCFLDFLPHAFENHHSSHEVISIFILAGVLVQGLADIYLLPHLAFLDKLLKKKDTKAVHAHSHTLSSGSVCSVAGCFAICSFFDGIRLFSALGIKESVAFLTAVGLFFHLLFEGVLVAVLGLSSGIKKQALFVLVFCVVGALLLGALMAQLLFISFSSEALIAFSSGILIYICFIHLLPLSLKKDNQIWFFTALILFSSIHFFI